MHYLAHLRGADGLSMLRRARCQEALVSMPRGFLRGIALLMRPLPASGTLVDPGPAFQFRASKLGRWLTAGDNLRKVVPASNQAEWRLAVRQMAATQLLPRLLQS